MNPDTLLSGDSGTIDAAVPIRHGESVIRLPVGSSAEAIADPVRALNAMFDFTQIQRYDT